MEAVFDGGGNRGRNRKGSDGCGILVDLSSTSSVDCAVVLRIADMELPGVDANDGAYGDEVSAR